MPFASDTFGGNHVMFKVLFEAFSNVILTGGPEGATDSKILCYIA